MARPVTLFTIQWGDLSLEEICALAQKMGYEGLELSAAHLDMKRAASDQTYVQQVKDTLAKYGLGCWSISNHLAGQCVCDTLPGAYCKNSRWPPGPPSTPAILRPSKPGPCRR